jgi:Flp pilus assembly protein TadB
VAQTKRKRRRKHKGTQGGKIDSRPKGRPRNRAEAKQRAQARRSGSGGGGKRAVAQQGPQPPTWGSAARKGLLAAAIFFALLAVAFQRPIGASIGIAAFMVAFYVPMAYFTDKFMYNRHLRKQQQERQAGAQGQNGS